MKRMSGFGYIVIKCQDYNQRCVLTKLRCHDIFVGDLDNDPDPELKKF